MTKTIVQKEWFAVSPERFYTAFMSSEEHSEFTGSEAIISSEVGGSYSAHGGYCEGTNLELIEGKMIVQTWLAHDDGWPEGHVSKISLKLEGDENHTVLHFTHEDLPADMADSIANGWNEYYWEPMKSYFK